MRYIYTLTAKKYIHKEKEMYMYTQSAQLCHSVIISGYQEVVGLCSHYRSNCKYNMHYKYKPMTCRREEMVHYSVLPYMELLYHPVLPITVW